MSVSSDHLSRRHLLAFGVCLPCSVVFTLLPCHPDMQLPSDWGQHQPAVGEPNPSVNPGTAEPAAWGGPCGFPSLHRLAACQHPRISESWWQLQGQCHWRQTV